MPNITLNEWIAFQEILAHKDYISASLEEYGFTDTLRQLEQLPKKQKLGDQRGFIP